MTEEIKDGGPAFPAVDNWRVGSGMSLRAYFAAHIDHEEIKIASGQLSLAAHEEIVGRQYPEKEYDDSVQGFFNRNDKEKRMKYQREVLKFNIELSAKIRYMIADQMIKEMNGEAE